MRASARWVTENTSDGNDAGEGMTGYAFSSVSAAPPLVLDCANSTSTNHSEYCAAAKAAKEAKWWQKLLTEIDFGRFVRPIDLFSDSKGCISMSYNPVARTASKHIDLADHYAREQQEAGTITITYVSTKDMIADALTKPLAQVDFTKHVKKLVMQI